MELIQLEPSLGGKQFLEIFSRGLFPRSWGRPRSLYSDPLPNGASDGCHEYLVPMSFELRIGTHGASVSPLAGNRWQPHIRII